MAVKHVDLDDVYLPKTNNNDIIVDVTIGEGQNGAYVIFFETDFISANGPANIGKRANVVGKKTTISVVIVDELEETNLTSMTVMISEGDNNFTEIGPFKAQAENHLDTVIYTLKLTHQ
ncbi:MAG: hypothetical protein JWP81_4437 [Ferruginibacter sp.]|nr:hypothetical protein [Ferruginibacter sp.]